MLLRYSVRMSFALALRVSFAGSALRDLVSYLASKPAEVEILCKTLTFDGGEEPVGTFAALSNLGRRRSLLPSLVRLRRLCEPFVSPRTCVAACTCISSEHHRCVKRRTQSSSRSSLRGLAGVQNHCIATHSGLPI